MVPLPPAELPATNVYMTIPSQALLQAQDGQINDNCKQLKYSNIPLVNQTTECSHQSQDVYPHNQFMAILQQCSVIMQ